METAKRTDKRTRDTRRRHPSNRSLSPLFLLIGAQTNMDVASKLPSQPTPKSNTHPQPTSNPRLRPNLFQEITSNKPEPIDLLPDEVQVYIAKVQPKQCGTLIKELGYLLPLVKFDDKQCQIQCIDDDDGTGTGTGIGDAIGIDDDGGKKVQGYPWPPLGHLRRVRRNNKTNKTCEANEDKNKHENGNEPPKKRTKTKNNVGSACKENSNSNSTCSNGNTNTTSKKKIKNKNKQNNSNVELDIVLGSVVHIDSILSHNNNKSDKKNEAEDESNTSIPVHSKSNKNETKTQCSKSKLQNLISTHKLQLIPTTLPGRPAQSQSELEQWKQHWWPTHYFEKQSLEYRTKELELDLEDEWGYMRDNLLEAVKDAKRYRYGCSESGLGSESQLESEYLFGGYGYGAVAYCPKSQAIVSRSFDEFQTKLKESQLNIHHQVRNVDVGVSVGVDVGMDANMDEKQKDKDKEVRRRLLENPLNNPVMFCIQGVSRREREAAMGNEKGMDSDEFKKGQYLCTGYDIYLTKEPGVFESMALVHSRVGRVFFGVEDKEGGGLGGTGSETSVHCLPGTNHRYRAFRCIDQDLNLDETNTGTEDSLYRQCKDLFPHQL